MKELNFKAVFAKAKTESEVKSLWAQVLNLSVKAQNERIAELKAAEKPKAKSETKSETKPKAKSESKPKTKPETKETKEKKEYTGIEAIKLTAAERKAVEAAGLKYVDYSEKSFAITGDTKPVKDIMKPNRNLSCGFGWIFAKVNESAVLSSLNITK